MFFDGEFRKLGSCDATPLAESIDRLSDDIWLEEAGRQEVYRAHRATQTIPLIFDADMRHDKATVRPRFEQFRPLLKPAMDRIEDYFRLHPPPGVRGDGYFQRILLVRLGAGTQIGSHRDEGPSLSRAHRIHLPVRTNDHTEFGIAGVIRQLAPGEIWEINNRKVHAVRNQGTTARIHVILDYVLPGEQIDDPAGPLEA